MADAPNVTGLPDRRSFQKFSAWSVGSKVYLFAIVPIIIYLLHLRATRLRVIPKGVPWVGLRNEWFSKTRANVRELFDSKLNIEQGYKKVGNTYFPHSLAFLCPSTLTKII